MQLHIKLVLCYKCGTELLIVISKAEKQKYKKASGIYCSVDESHICQWISSAEDKLDFRKLFGSPTWVNDDDDERSYY